MHVLVEIEGRDDHDGQGVLDAWASELAGGLDAVDARHPDVEEADVGTQLACHGDRLVTVRCLADDLDPGLRVEDHGEPGADQELVVGDHHPDGHRGTCRGRVASTVQPPSGSGPA
jgi:hypothetical protein